MFVSENILLNTTVSVLEKQQKDDVWSKRDIIFTDRALYIFAAKKQDREYGVNYLNEAHERMNLQNFVAAKPGMAPGQNQNEIVQEEPFYMRYLPSQRGPFAFVVEIQNLETNKIRILALRNLAESELFLSIFNLVASYRRYEAFFGDNAAKGPEFLQKWVKTYQVHKGELRLPKEAFLRKNVPYIREFGHNNISIKKLILDESLQFDMSTNSQANNQRINSSGGVDKNAEITRLVSEIIASFNGESISFIQFQANGMTDATFGQIQRVFQRQSSLIHLEIVYNLIGDQTLELLANEVFTNRPTIQNVILNNNRLGSSENSQKAMCTFLEEFLCKLHLPKKLDISSNLVNDECCEPILYYLLANEECHLEELNIEHNLFSHYSKRTFAQAHLRTPNVSLKFKFGPLTLSKANLHLSVMQRKAKVIQKGEKMSSANTTPLSSSKSSTNKASDKNNNSFEKVTIHITRRARMPDAETINYLPTGKYEQELLKRIRERIRTMCDPAYRNTLYTEDLREFVKWLVLGKGYLGPGLHPNNLDQQNGVAQLMLHADHQVGVPEMQGETVDFELPKHLMQPIFGLINEKLQKAIQTDDLYQLELLLDTLRLMDAFNPDAERKYMLLKKQARLVSFNLIRAINMEIHDDNELLKTLVDNLQRAKKIGMRGDLIDIATTLKALCTKLLQEMLARTTTNADEEDDPMKQVFMLKEEDLRRSVYDPFYDNQVGLVDMTLSTELEPNLALHPFRCDYIAMAAININYLKKNMALSRKHLVDEETYSLLNVYTRCAFLFSDGKPDSSKSLEFNNARDDKLLKFARILFRYKHNLDELFGAQPEPLICQDFALFDTKRKYAKGISAEEICKVLDESIEGGLRVEDYPRLSLEVQQKKDNFLTQSGTPLAKPLTRITSAQTQAALKFSQMLCKIQLDYVNGAVKGEKEKEKSGGNRQILQPVFKQIRTLFEQCIIQGSTMLNEDLIDEFYLQLYRQGNISADKKQRKELFKPILLVLVFLARYSEPQDRVLRGQFKSWLVSKRDESHQADKLINIALWYMKNTKNQGNSRKPMICWPPSVIEIDSLDQLKPTKIVIQWPGGETKHYEVNEATTIESLLRDKIYKERFFEHAAESQFYWLFQQSENVDSVGDPGFPMPITKEKRLLKLLYQDEKRYEQLEDDYRFRLGRQTSALSKATLPKDARPSINDFEHFQDADSGYKTLRLFLRKRLFSSLHSIPNFRVISKSALSFIYHQKRSDFVDLDIPQQPKMTSENAVLLAALSLQVKRYKSTLTQKENTLKPEMISKNIDYCLPQSLLASSNQNQRRATSNQSWEKRIMSCFEQNSLKELTAEEAMEQYLTLLASYKFTFASYFVIRRKPLSSLGSGAALPPKAALGGRRRLNSILRANLDKKKAHRQRNKAKEKQKTKFGSDSSSNEYESSSSSSSSQQQSLDSQEDDSNDQSQSTFNDGSGSIQNSAINASIEDKKTIELLDELFPSISADILLIVSYEFITFFDKAKRDSTPGFTVKMENLLYCMGKKDVLKIGFTVNSMEVKMQDVNIQRPLGGKKQGLDQNTLDVRCQFIVPNARVIAEDILGYLQLNLVEQTKGKDYIELLKPKLFDLIAGGEDMDSRLYGDKSSHLDNSFSALTPKGPAPTDANNNKQGFNIVVNDDLLRGNVSFTNGSQTKQDLKKLGTKTAANLEKLNSSQKDDSEDSQSQLDESVEPSAFSEDEVDSGSMLMDNQSRSKKPTQAMLYERMIARMAGYQFRFKRRDFLIYTRKHPTYTFQPSVVASQNPGSPVARKNSQSPQHRDRDSGSGSSMKGKGSQSPQGARTNNSGSKNRQIHGHGQYQGAPRDNSFALENHTIDEEGSEDLISQHSLINRDLQEADKKQSSSPYRMSSPNRGTRGVNDSQPGFSLDNSGTKELNLSSADQLYATERGRKVDMLPLNPLKNPLETNPNQNSFQDKEKSGEQNTIPFPENPRHSGGLSPRHKPKINIPSSTTSAGPIRNVRPVAPVRPAPANLPTRNQTPVPPLRQPVPKPIINPPPTQQQPRPVRPPMIPSAAHHPVRPAPIRPAPQLVQSQAKPTPGPTPAATFDLANFMKQANQASEVAQSEEHKGGERSNGKNSLAGDAKSSGESKQSVAKAFTEMRKSVPVGATNFESKDVDKRKNLSKTLAFLPPPPPPPP